MGGRHRLPSSRPWFARQLAASALLAGSVGFVGYLGLTGTDVLYVVPPEPVPALPVEPTMAPSTTLPAPPPTTAPPPSSTTPAPTTTTNRPAPATPRPAPVPAPKPAAKACPSSGFGGVKAHVAAAGNHLVGRFDVSRVLGRGARTVTGSFHPLGLALDLFVDRSTGDRLAAYALANRSALGVSQVIWEQRINFGVGWSVMEDRGSITSNHFDHVHLSFNSRPGPGLPC